MLLAKALAKVPDSSHAVVLRAVRFFLSKESCSYPRFRELDAAAGEGQKICQAQIKYTFMLDRKA
jgi:hypothetical protein